MNAKVSDDNLGANPAVPSKGWANRSDHVILIINSNGNNKCNNDQGWDEGEAVGPGND